MDLTGTPRFRYLMERYYESRGRNPEYTVLRTIVIDGHECYLLQYDGTVEYDLMQQGREGNTYTGQEFQCECHFTEDVGWRHAEGQRLNLMGGEHCLQMLGAQEYRYLELRKRIAEDYHRGHPDAFGSGGQWWQTTTPLEYGIVRLMELAKEGEWLGEGSGAHFWGGYFYLGTASKIMDFPLGKLFWDRVNPMLVDHKFRLEGMVVQDWRPDREPEWEESIKVHPPEVDWYFRVLQPAHSETPHQWKIERLLRADDTVLDTRYEQLYHPVDFGIDVEDRATLNAFLHAWATELETIN